MAWHPALERTLQIARHFHGNDAEQARAQLLRLLDDRVRAADGFTGSLLTMSGFPVEIAFSTADDALRYTFDPALPGSDPRGRVDTALGQLAALGAAPVP
ncbi:hypothetical protein, partial [Pseudomonas chlororaphis]